MGLRPAEIILILAIVVLLFGAKKLPELAKSIGQSMKIIRKETADTDDDAHARIDAKATEAPAAPAQPAPATQTPAGRSDDTDRA